MNFRNFFAILLIMIIFALTTIISVAAGPLELSKKDIISPDKISISLDGRKIYPQLIKFDGIIYAKAEELLSTFGYRHSYSPGSDIIKIEEISLPSWRAGYISENGSQELYLPLLEILSLLDIRYTYSDLYGEDLISIRTYNEDQYVYSQPGLYDNAPNFNISIDGDSDNNNINIDYEQPSAENTVQAVSNDANSNYAGYFSPVNSVPALIAKSNFDNQVRGYGLRTRLGFYSVYGVEPQPYGTGFPNALTPNYYYNSYPYTYPTPYYQSPCNTVVSPYSTWCTPQPCNTGGIYLGP